MINPNMNWKWFPKKTYYIEKEWKEKRTRLWYWWWTGLATVYEACYFDGNLWIWRRFSMDHLTLNEYLDEKERYEIIRVDNVEQKYNEFETERKNREGDN